MPIRMNFTVFVSLMCNCSFVEFSAMKISKTSTVHQNQPHENFKHENVRSCSGRFSVYLSFHWSDGFSRKMRRVVNLENQSDKLYRIARPKKTRRVSPLALIFFAVRMRLTILQKRSRFPFSKHRLVPPPS